MPKVNKNSAPHKRCGEKRFYSCNYFLILDINDKILAINKLKKPINLNGNEIHRLNKRKTVAIR